jgi:hypothetical protein
MRTVGVVALFLLVFSTPVLAQKTKEYRIGGIDTGEGYLRHCPKIHPNMPFGEVLHANYCYGYVRGIIDYNRVLNAFPGLVDPKKNIALSFSIFCPPENLGSAEADKILRKYMEEHPERLNRPTASLVADALAKDYPCTAAAPKGEPGTER